MSGDTNLPWMTLLFQRQTLELRTYAQKHKLKPFDRHFAFPERVSASCNKRQQPHICKPPPHPESRRLRVFIGRKTPPAYLRVSTEELTCPAASFAPFLWILVFRWSPLCVRQRHVIITEEDCALLCATSGLLGRANERSWCWWRGRSALWVM